MKNLGDVDKFTRWAAGGELERLTHQRAATSWVQKSTKLRDLVSFGCFDLPLQSARCRPREGFQRGGLQDLTSA